MKARSEQTITQPVYAVNTMFVPPKAEALIAVHFMRSLPDRDFLFQSKQAELSLFAYLVDPIMTSILIRNDSDRIVKISRNQRLGKVYDADFDNCFHITHGR